MASPDTQPVAAQPAPDFTRLSATVDSANAVQDPGLIDAVFRTLLEAETDPTAIKDPQGRYLAVNQPWLHAFDQQPADILSHTDDALLPAEEAAMSRAMEQRVATSRTVMVTEEQITAGAWRGFCRIVRRPIVDERDTLRGVLVILRGLPLHQPRGDRAGPSRDALLAGVAAVVQALLAASDLDAAISRSVRILGAAASVHRVHVFQLADGQKRSGGFARQYLWQHHGGDMRETPTELDADDRVLLHAWLETLRSGQPVVGSTASMPPELQAPLKRQGVNAVLVIPVVVEGSVWGALRFDDCVRGRVWTSAEIAIITGYANTLGAAIARERMETELREARDALERHVMARTSDLTAANAELQEQIDRREAVERELRLQRDFSENLIQTAPVLILVLDRRGSIVHCNQSVEDLLDRPRSELTGRDWIEALIPGEEQDATRLQFLSAMAGTARGTGGTGVLAASGRRIEVEWQHGPLRDAEGGLVGMLLIGLDVTQQRWTLQSLQRSERTNRETLDAMPFRVAVVDQSGRLASTNARWESERARPRFPRQAVGAGGDLFAACRDQPGGRELIAAIHRILREEARDGRVEIAVDAETESPSWYAAHLTGLHHAEGVRVLLALEDVTPRRQAEQANQRLTMELEHASRLSLMGEMASGIAHELNQPLAAIATYAEGVLAQAQARGGDADADNSPLERIGQLTHRCAEIIRRLRAFVAKRPHQLAEASINDLVRDVTALAAPVARERSIQIDLDLEDQAPARQVDSVQVQLVVMNLLRNAMDALADLPDGERRITVRTDRRGDALRVSVHDTGPGVPEDVTLRLFEPFFSTKPEGMGIGLSLSRSIIESHGGRLWLEPSSRGACFCFDLPSEPLHAPPSSSFARRGERWTHHGGRP